jgi:hypothetical protein
MGAELFPHMGEGSYVLVIVAGCNGDEVCPAYQLVA